ncbi:MAG: futalosine hydrolase [Bacteroidetes bacterium]|nr:futalosine hydrolase [Bacteroidota bacterium]MBS1632588.1 futalosine hydrolase [Bacteroidota bacterium]
MQILLTAATIVEIEPFVEQVRKNKISRAVDILITGIGLTATTYRLTKQIQLKRPDIVLQAGVAGCFDQNLELGSVVLVKRDTIADQSVIELKKLKSLFNLKMIPHNQFPYRKNWLVNPHLELAKKQKLKQVSGISVNQITTSKQIIRFYEKEFSPIVESMEGAALHYVCLMEQIPFLQIRSTSNYIGERNKNKWNMNESILNLNKSLFKLVTSLS